MLMTITYNGQNTEDIGFLLHKNPNRPQKFELNFGNAYVFYPELSNERTTAALLLEINPVNLARGKEGAGNYGLFDYVNDRPYVSSSFLSTAISKVFGTALNGRADSHQDLSDSSLDLEATITMLPCKTDTAMLNKIFEPLGYEVNYETFINDELFPDWGESKYVNLTIKGKQKLRDLLKHIYILVPVFDQQKHYWVGEDEVEKLLRNTGDWLADHPEKEYITSRYLKRLRPLVNKAFSMLFSDGKEETLVEIHEEKLSLRDQRLNSVVSELKSCNAKSVIDIGCGEGNLLCLLIKEKQFEKITGTDVSVSALEKAKEKLKIDTINENLKERINIFQSSLIYKDSRYGGYDAACVIEVIEHLNLFRLGTFEKILFSYIKSRIIIITTPNKEYNHKYRNVGKEKFRHDDHRFEWTRAEFNDWAEKMAEQYGYKVKFAEIGESDEISGSATQMGVFTLCE